MRAPLLIIPSLVALAAAGCGGGEDGLVIEASPAAVAGAGEATLEANTARMVTTMTMDMSGLVPGFDEPIEITALGEVDFANNRSVMEMDMAAMFEQLAGSELGGGEAETLQEMFAEPFRVIQDGTVMYQCGPMFQFAAGAQCVRIDVSEMPGVDASQLGTPSPADPGAMLESLQGAGEVEEVGEEEIDGVPTSHLRGTFTLADAIDELPAEAVAEFEAQYEELGLDGSLDDDQRFDIWIDEDGLVRQLRQELTLGGDDGLTTSVEVRFVSFGDELDLEIPTDVVDFQDVFGELPG